MTSNYEWTECSFLEMINFVFGKKTSPGFPKLWDYKPHNDAEAVFFEDLSAIACMSDCSCKNLWYRGLDPCDDREVLEKVIESPKFWIGKYIRGNK